MSEYSCEQLSNHFAELSNDSLKPVVEFGETSPSLTHPNISEKARQVLLNLAQSKSRRDVIHCLHELREMSIHASCLSAVVEHNGPTIILNTMINMASICRVQEICCLLLESWMIHNSVLLTSIVNNKKILRHIVQVMNAYSDVGTVQIAIMKTLVQFSTNDEARNYLLRPPTDAVSSVVVSMFTFANSVVAQVTACKALASLLANKKERQIELVLNEDHRLVTKAMWKHPTSRDLMLSACRLFTVLACTEENLHVFIDDKLHLTLLQHLKDFFTDSDVVCAGFHLLHMFLGTDSVCDQLISAQVGPMLLEVVFHFLDNPLPLLAGIRVFKKLVGKLLSDESYRQEKEWLKLISLIMSQHRDQRKLLELCCEAMCILLEYRPALQELIGESTQTTTKINPLHTLCLCAILMHPKAERTFCAACDAIYWMSADSPRIQQLLLEKNTHMAILDGMKYHKSRSRPQSSGCRAIRGLCVFSMKHKWQVTNYDKTLFGLMSIFGQFPNDKALQLEVISTIGCLADIELVRNQCLIEGVHVKVLDCMESDHDNELMQDAGLETLAVLAAGDGGASLLCTDGAIAQVVESMKSFSQSFVVQKKGLILLQLLANKDYSASQPELVSVVEAIMAAITGFLDLSSIQAEGCVCIQVWCEHCMDITVQFVDKGAPEHLFTAIEMYGNQSDVFELASEALYVLACMRNYKSAMLLSACSKGMIAGVECLLELGADVNVGQGQETPLCYACKSEDVLMTKMLLKQGVTDINTALQMSLKQQSDSIVGILLKELGRDTRDKDAGTIVWSGFGLGNIQPEWLVPSFLGENVTSRQTVSESGKQIARFVKCTGEKHQKRDLLLYEREPCKTPMRFNYSADLQDLQASFLVENSLETLSTKAGRRKLIQGLVSTTRSGFKKILSPKRRSTAITEQFQRSLSDRGRRQPPFFQSPMRQFASCPADLEEHRLTSLSGSDVPCSPLDPRLKLVPENTIRSPSPASPWGRRRLQRVSSPDTLSMLQSPANSTRSNPRLGRHLSLPVFNIDREISLSEGDVSETSIDSVSEVFSPVKLRPRRLSGQFTSFEPNPRTSSPIPQKRTKSWTDLFETEEKGIVRVLDLSANGISSLTDILNGGPTLLLGFCVLENLDLSHNSLYYFPDALLKSMPNLKYLYLHHNNMEKIPSEVFTFCKKLVELDISDNKIDDVHATPSNVSLSLQQLKISNNMLGVFPEWLVDYFPVLERLSLDGNRIRELPAQPLTLKRLKMLNLSHNYLRVIPDEFLTACHNLEELLVMYNELEVLPVATVAPHLSHLFSVKLSHNHLSDRETGGIPKLILDLPNLRILDLSHNSISHLASPDLWKTLYLKELLLSHNKISVMKLSPGAKLWSLTLERLVLSHNNLQEIPKEIGLLTCLTSLDVSYNPDVTTLPDELGRLSKLWELPLCGLNLDLDEALQRGRTKDLIGYLHERLKRAESHYRMKMMIVGFGQRGKSSLLQALKREKSQTIIQPTVGIVVSDWKFHRRNRQDKMVQYTLNTWDLAGQEQFYSSHQCFLSTRTLYLVVYNVSADIEEINTLSPWLLNIQARAPDCPVIIVGTHKDKLPKESRGSHISEMRNGIMELLRKPGHNVSICGILEVCSARDNSDIEKLRNLIHSTINGFQCRGQFVMGQKVPASYKKLEDCISNMAKHKNTFPVITHKVLVKLKNNAKLDLDEDELKQAVRFLHEAGVLLHYEDYTLQLNDLYFIDPGWLCRMMAQVITVREINPFISDQGVLKRSDVHLLFRGGRVGEDVKYTFPVSLIPQYLRLLEKFEIALPKNEEELLITSRLSATHPEIQIPTPKKQDLICQDMDIPYVERHYVLSYTPLGFWSRLLTRLLVYCQETKSLGVHKTCPSTLQYWKEGIFAMWSSEDFFSVQTMELGSGVIVLKVPATCQGIRIFGNLIDLVDNLIDEWYPGLCVRDPEGRDLITRLVPCVKCQGDPPHMFTFEELLCESESTMEICCPNHQEPVTLRHIAPDLSLADLEPQFQLNADDLLLIESPENLLGEGGYGAVYKAEYQTRSVAVKVFSAKTDAHPHKLLRQEVAIFRSIQHASLVNMLSVSVQPRLIVMELAPHGSLATQLKNGRVSHRSLQHRIALQVAEGLEYLHSQGIIYRDMKPDNVLMFNLSPGALVIAKLSDYGISQMAAPYGLSSQEGTIGYRAPEVARGEPYIYQADVYSYGITVFEIVTGGRHPMFELEFRSQLDEAVMCGRPFDKITSVSGVDPWPDIQDLIDCCLQMVPEHRPSSSDIVHCLQSSEVTCLKGAFPVSRAMTVECMCVRRGKTGGVEVWLGSGERDSVQLSWLTLSHDHQEHQGRMFNDCRILCMEAIEQRAMLIGTQSGNLWVYDASTREKSCDQPIKLSDSVLCICHVRSSRGMDAVIIGLANGSLVKFETNNLILDKEAEPQYFELGLDCPIKCIQWHQDKIYVSCGSDIYRLSARMRVEQQWNIVSDRHCVISQFVLSKTIYISVHDTPKVILRGGTRWTPRGVIDMAQTLSQFNYELPSYTSARVTSMFLQKTRHLGNALWVGTGGGHIVLIDTTTHLPLKVFHRHTEAVRTICTTSIKGAGVSDILTGGMGLSGKLSEQSDSTGVPYGYVLQWDEHLMQQTKLMEAYNKKRAKLVQAVDQKSS